MPDHNNIFTPPEFTPEQIYKLEISSDLISAFSRLLLARDHEEQ